MIDSYLAPNLKCHITLVPVLVPGPLASQALAGTRSHFCSLVLVINFNLTATGTDDHSPLVVHTRAIGGRGPATHLAHFS